MAQHELNTQAQVDKNITDLEKVNARQDAALKKAMTLDRQQDSDLNGIENQISQLWDRFQTIKSAKPTQSNSTTPAVNYKPTLAPVATGLIKQSTPEPTSVNVPQTVYVAEPEKLPEKDQEIYAQVKNLETELNNKISAMAKWDQVAQMDTKSRNELEALRKDTERTSQALQKKITSFNKRLGKQQSTYMGQASQVEKTPTLAAPEAGDDIMQKISRANKRAKYGGTATNVVPAGAPDNQQDILHRLSSYSDSAQTYQKTGLGRQRSVAMHETTVDQFDTGAGKELSRSPEIRRLQQIQNYELMLKKELANRTQDRDDADEEQDFQDMNESTMKRMLSDLGDLSDADFLATYKRPKQYWRNQMSANPTPAVNINDIESDDLDQARTRPTFGRQGQIVKQRRTPVQQGMKRMLGTPKNVRPTPTLEPVSVTMQVPNRKTDRYDLLPARIFNSEAEATEFARRVNGHITGINPVMHEGATKNQRLHAGDPVVVTAPNEFEGATGEIYELSPSGTFVIVNLYNHGKHSMHLSDVAYNQYADKQEQDDWYDEEVEEGFVPLDQYSPTAVCLAGKPVKKFDYYKDAERFHNNWKKKLYREGNKAKADKITLMPIMDEDVKTIKGAHGRLDVDTNTPGVTKVRQKDRLGAKTFTKDPYRVGGSGIGQKSPDTPRGSSLNTIGAYNRNPSGRTFPRLDHSDNSNQLAHYSAEAANPAQQAAIAIAMKKAGKKPKQVDEAGTRAGALNTAQQLYKEIQAGKGKKQQHEIDLLQRQLNALVRKYQLKPEEYTTSAGQQSQQQQSQQPPPPPPGGQQAGQQSANQQQGNWWDQYYEKYYGQANRQAQQAQQARQQQQRQQPPPPPPPPPPPGGQQAGGAAGQAGKFGFPHPSDPNWAQKHLDASARMMQANQADMNKAFQSMNAAGPWNMPGAKMAAEEAEVAEGAMSNLHADLAEVYRRMAPGIERHRDSFKAGQLYDALEAVAEQHNAHREFTRMMGGARNRAHMDYDTNPGGFQNWFWYLPFAEEELEEGSDLINMSDLQFYKELLGVMIIPVAAFGAMAWHKAMNAIKLYRAEDVITALQKKGVTVDRSTLEQIKPLLLKLEQAIDVDKDGDVAKELAKRIQQTVTWGKLKQVNPDTTVNRKSEIVEEQDTSGVESAIIRRIMVAHTDLLKQFGPEKVMQAAEEVAYNVGNVDEIGTSDVSAYVNQVRQILGA